MSAEVETPELDADQGPGTRRRRDIAAGASQDEAGLIRFVANPAGEVVADLARKLPGRGFWVAARRDAVDLAVRKGAFPRAAKAAVKVPPDLSDQVEALLVRQCLQGLGLARKAGALTSGFEKVRAALVAGEAAWVIEASDGAADGRSKILALARRSPRPPEVCGAFSADELGLALGLGHAIHTAFHAGRWAERWGEALGRLAGFRPILPERWSEEVGDRDSGRRP